MKKHQVICTTSLRSGKLTEKALLQQLIEYDGEMILGNWYLENRVKSLKKVIHHDYSNNLIFKNDCNTDKLKPGKFSMHGNASTSWK